MLLDETLGDEAAHGMSDDDGGRVEPGGGRGDVGDVIGESERIQLLPAGAATVAAEGHGDAPKAGFGEERQKMLGPDPGAAKGAVDEQERRPARRLARREDLERLILAEVHGHGGLPRPPAPASVAPVPSGGSSPRCSEPLSAPQIKRRMKHQN